MLITNSSFCCYRNCPRKYYYRYVLGRRRPGGDYSPALALGTAVHDWLDWLYTEGIDERQLFSFQPPRLPGSDLEPKEQLIATAMVAGYLNRWQNDSWQVRAALCEYEFRVPLPINGVNVELAGKFDMVAWHDDNRIYLWEHKTAGRIDGTYLGKLWSDSQITAYVFALQSLGIDCNQVIYNVLPKPSIRQRVKSGETLAEYGQRLIAWYQSAPFHRENVIVGKRQIEHWLDDVRDYCCVLADNLAAHEIASYPRNTQRCFDWGRACEYVPVCQAGNPDGLLLLDYERSPRHPELDHVAKEENAL